MERYKDLLSQLEDYANDNYLPMHMPGGKRKVGSLDAPNPYAYDITEIDGFDNMHNPNGVIKDMMCHASRIFGADYSFPLINGSTAGILTAISAVCHEGERVLVARNCHISVYNGIMLNNLKADYFMPKMNEYGIYMGVKLSDIQSFFDKASDYSAVIITSPTYEGYVSDVKEIAEFLHARKIPLIVDEAHGAHFCLSESFPQSAVENKADIVIQSIHKTLPALTQTAVLHVCGKLVDKDRIIRYWNIYQTTSPSYILLGSIDRCLSILDVCNVEKYVDNLVKLREKLRKVPNIKLLETDDISKIVLITDDGKNFAKRLLDEYKIQLEMASYNYVIAMTSFMDTEEDYERFLTAVTKVSAAKSSVAESLSTELSVIESSVIESSVAKLPAIESSAANFNDEDNYNESGEYAELLKYLEANLNKKSEKIVAIYPPGIPAIAVGELITKEVIGQIRRAVEADLEIVYY